MCLQTIFVSGSFAAEPRRCCLGLGTRSGTCFSSQSQFGEETTVIDAFGWHDKSDGVYVEIGALDGIKYSNTLSLHTCLGWTGLLVEGSPRNFHFLRRNLLTTRPENVVAHFGAVCAPPLTNTTFLRGRKHGAVDADIRHVSDTVTQDHAHHRRTTVPCKPMSWYLQSLPRGHVDFFSLDVEGAELEVLLTMNFNAVVVEVFMVELHAQAESDKVRGWKVRNLLENLGYQECQHAKVKYSGLFVRRQGPYVANC
ncbi:unnamed protein product [Symbiodinium pilosum]|uniref:Methyltransferase FkbM domain-containing protein n=1 Tax=Symbiodinium pilosum TaxID=2952 RepID=A0A812VQH0_SYMPI|nr:unnamed protein product [Symbiodinium pilosum]